MQGNRLCRMLFGALLAVPAAAQMSGMNHQNLNRAGRYLMNMSSGTAMNPYSWQMPMVMTQAGSWNLMFMGQAFLVDTQQSGSRGGDKLYSANWSMVTAIHSFAGGSLALTAMVSLEPATITDRRYPLLFQTGETAYGQPLVDAQHPHDLLMALSAQYAHPLDPDTMLQLYYAPVGDPALGPVAFPHRASAFELPQAPLGHHWQDSTHIADNVATVAMRHKWLRLEASGFYGTEPNENRWNLDWGKMNSYSARVSVTPNANWLAQISAGHLTQPERQQEGDVDRTTASLQYSRPLDRGTSWSTSLIWGRNHQTANLRNLNSWLLETLYPATRRDFLTARVELVDKDELFANQPAIAALLARTAGSTFRIQEYIVGYTRDIATLRNVEAGVGANVAFYRIPPPIQPYYGEHPRGLNVYLRFRLKPAR
jgi:hypothetical protein